MGFQMFLFIAPREIQHWMEEEEEKDPLVLILMVSLHRERNGVSEK